MDPTGRFGATSSAPRMSLMGRQRTFEMNGTHR